MPAPFCAPPAPVPRPEPATRQLDDQIKPGQSGAAGRRAAAAGESAQTQAAPRSALTKKAILSRHGAEESIGNSASPRDLGASDAGSRMATSWASASASLATRRAGKTGLIEGLNARDQREVQTPAAGTARLRAARFAAAARAARPAEGDLAGGRG